MWEVGFLVSEIAFDSESTGEKKWPVSPCPLGGSFLPILLHATSGHGCSARSHTSEVFRATT